MVRRFGEKIIAVQKKHYVQQHVFLLLFYMLLCEEDKQACS